MRKTKLKVRILSWILCFLMIFTAIPTYAEENVSGNAYDDFSITVDGEAVELKADGTEPCEDLDGDATILKVSVPADAEKLTIATT